MIDPNTIVAKPPSQWSGRIPTFSGTGFSPFSPRVDDVNLIDIVYGLVHTKRYGGHSFPVITIAEHSVLVSRLIEILWGVEFALAGLFHDACEAYVHDMQAPLRPSISVKSPDGNLCSWQQSDRRINDTIFLALELDPAQLDHPQVRAADILACSFEQRDCLNLTGDWGLPEIPAEVSHLGMRFWKPEEAMSQFLARYKELVSSPLSV